MKKIFVLFLAFVLVLGLAACGETKTAEVVENVDPNDNNIVIETPPAVVSGTDNTYTPDTSLPGANAPVPTTSPTSAPPSTAAPIATADPNAPGGGTGETGENGDGEGDDGDDGETPTDSYKDYNPTINKWEMDHGRDGYVTGEGVFFRIGPGTEYKVIIALSKGTKVLIVDELASGWCKIVFDEEVGYLWGGYLSYTAPTDTPAVVVTDAPSPSPSAKPSTSPTPKPEAGGTPTFVPVP